MGIKVQTEMNLVMWEKQIVKDRKQDPNTKEWVDAGTESEKTKYYLRDEFGDKLEFLAGNEYRDMEGSLVIVTLDISFNEWKNQNVVKLESITQLP